MKKTLLLIMAIIVFVSGCYHEAKIEQEVDVDSYVECTYYVKTYVWVYNCFLGIPGLSVSIEGAKFASNVKRENVETVKISQYNEMFPLYLAVQGCIDSGIDPCE